MATIINWFPGHMAKAIRQFEENIKVVDVVFEILDARIPISSINPEITRISRNKPRLLILTKADLADPQLTKQWLLWFQKQGQAAITIDAKTPGVQKKVEQAAKRLLANKLSQQQAKGFSPQKIKAICVGVPNVGKSTLLNQLINRRSAPVGNRPGVTKGQQWLTGNGHLELLDTPGILWPKFADQRVAEKLALTGAIRERAYHSDDVALFAIQFFKQTSPNVLLQRYHLDVSELELANPELLLTITAKLGMKDDYDRAADRIITDVRKGKLGPFTLDNPYGSELTGATD
ncbi:50S ribosomal subunit maturation GTPase RbgA (YlqF) [Fructilactobacillus florum 8D]|uniref:Ribosome biogenesis GTPase A n=1 Tax=Fructilactobacillus florum 8D TaxID=1221538 RepID=W9EHW9_9LACO|nr:ribosome biogenesis GTPase YlqF [Fructilactobacillus florum]EKK21160.1 50S ribosomal subunit maturation GTPase RbgA (YlqF) [Fructilactobacillus florum 2F]ETO40585.1 50S ribosomal subunit maturation GTPase RbgA (YlqF) [Fructilactobacillus florum 8D]